MIDGLTLGDRILPASLPHGGFNGVAATERAIYVNSDVDNAVYQFKR